MANILQDVQDFIVGKLSADYQLSGMCTFLSENRKDIDYEIKNALGREGLVAVVMTPKATYAGKYENSFLAWTLESIEIDIVENVTVNRGKKSGFMTGQDVGLRVFDVLCPLDGEEEGKFSPVSVEEGEDNGLVVNKCILKALVYGEHGDVPQPEKPITYQFVKLLDQPPPLSVQPHDGWMWSDDGQLFFYVNHEAHKLGDVTQSVMSAYVDSQVSSKAEISSVPTKTSDLSNDSGFITANDIPAIPTKTSELSNDSGFIQQNGSAVIHDLTCDQLVANQAYIVGYATESDLSSKADLSAIPTKTSELSNDSGFITSADVPTKTSQLSNDSGFITSAAIEDKRDWNDISYPASIEEEDYNITSWTLVVDGQESLIDKTWTFDLFERTSDVRAWYARGLSIQEAAGVSTSDGHNFRLDMEILRNDWVADDDILVYGAFSLDSIVDGQTSIINLTWEYRDRSGGSHNFTAPMTIAMRITSFALKDYVDSRLSALESDIPTKTSDLSNDSGFITSADIPVKPVPFTIKQDRSLYPSSQTITIKTSQTNTLSVQTNPNGSSGTFVASFLISEWNSSTTLSDVVTAPDTVGCFVFKTSGQMNDTWGNLKTTLISSTESFGIALPL